MVRDLLTPTHRFISLCLTGSVEGQVLRRQAWANIVVFLQKFQELTSLTVTLELCVLPHHGTGTPARVFLAWCSRLYPGLFLH